MSSSQQERYPFRDIACVRCEEPAGGIGTATATLGSTAPLTQNAPAGILGMLVDAGQIDPENPDRPPAGGLLGLIQDDRNNPATSGSR